MIRQLASALLVVAAMAPNALAVPNGPAEKSLDKCQNTLRTEGVKYVQNTQKAIAMCLGKISGEVVKKNAGSVAAAVNACTLQFKKIGRTDGRSIADSFTAKVSAKCSPAPANAHTLDDLLGSGSPGVAEPLNAGTSLGALCATYGGDGSVDSLGEWLECVKAAQDCSVQNAISTEFPRALEWLNDVAAAMPPSDARNAVVATEAAIDGASDDGVPSLQCGSTCGDGVKIATEQCDGAALAGATCESLGFAAGTLACGSTCSFDTSGCTGGFLATGQTTCWGGDRNAPVPIPCAGTGQDGETQSGKALAYVDNGDGTITDVNTGLMWEKKSDDGTLNDKDLRYPWAGLCSGDGVTLCGRDADCAGPGGVCENGDFQTASPNGITIFEWVDQLNAATFGGHDDWRVPNIRELESLVNYELFSPSVSAPFNVNCGASSSGNPGCTIATCSCTVPSVYWSSSTVSDDPRIAWSVNFDNGDVVAGVKGVSNLFVRAVRGGS